MIQCTDIFYTYPDNSFPALKGISFSVNAGERVAVMGANGSGKTTLIRCINGLIRPDSGSISVDGLSLDNPDHLYEIRRRVGMVFQNPDNQIVATTIERELAFGLENLGIPQQEIRSKIESALKRFRLDQYRNHPPHLLSGGERQKLALASIWVMEPQYLILDEPTSLLDPRSRMKIFDLLDAEMDGRNLGIVLVTQIPEESFKCDRLVVLENGNVLYDDHPAKVFLNTEQLKKAGLRLPVCAELETDC